MEILTEFQKQFITAISKSLLRDSFFLTGGTALSAFYLHHRYSEDLDFFTEIPDEVSRMVPELEKICQKLTVKLEINRRFKTFLNCTVTSDKSEHIKIDFAQDTPFRLQPLIFNEEFGIYIDNTLDIACNKFSALFDRAATKDFVDIYLINKVLFSFDEIYENAKKKHVGLDDYWLAISLQKVNLVEELPRMVVSLTIEELKEFFNDKVKNLMKKIEE
ncbi:nucleotidyl transferase AbiEii/AbiGii toxin family protein [candidate division KSB1 bacterium]|nr:nucleotidyl transferase AbiEii/AbiGii toxin family protein [candidate division KSB1 bacterium]